MRGTSAAGDPGRSQGPVAGVLLTGGGSTRMGTPKATLRLAGERLADRGARVLLAACSPVLEVGPGFTSLPAAREDPPGGGPLAALDAGVRVLRARGHDGPVIVLAVDLPGIEPELVELLATHADNRAVVPRVAGVPQPLAARYPETAGDVAARLLAAGERSMRALLRAMPVAYLDEPAWSRVATASAFDDVDDRVAAARWGIEGYG